jgi:hypothetical protein
MCNSECNSECNDEHNSEHDSERSRVVNDEIRPVAMKWSMVDVVQTGCNVPRCKGLDEMFPGDDDV